MDLKSLLEKYLKENKLTPYQAHSRIKRNTKDTQLTVSHTYFLGCLAGRYENPKPETLRALSIGLEISYIELMVICGHLDLDDVNNLSVLSKEKTGPIETILDAYSKLSPKNKKKFIEMASILILGLGIENNTV